MAFPPPSVGDWYRLNGGEPFEVVAVDDDDSTIEVQYADGSVEELDLEDWNAWCDERLLALSDAPEDWSDAADIEADEGRPRLDRYFDRYDDDRDLRARGLDGIDIFDAT